MLSLWGEPGDLAVEFTHLKPPAALCGPWTVTLDPDAGTVGRDAPLDLVGQVRRRGVNGMTAEAAARLLYGSAAPGRAEVQRARRRLTRLANQGVLWCREGSRGGAPAGLVPCRREESRGQSRWSRSRPHGGIGAGGGIMRAGCPGVITGSSHAQSCRRRKYA